MAISWHQESMSTGVPEIDAEHKELLRRFNDFHEAVKNRHGKEALERTLTFLTAYTASHFTHEEACMSRLRCRAAEANKVAHDAMRGEIAKIKSRIASEGIQSLDVVQLERILGDWLRTHICTVDVQLRECVHPSS
jgi:hemerythrin-like metal-binding protein